MKEKKSNAGRPSAYRECHAELAYRIIKAGNSVSATAYILGIDRQTYYNWLKTKEEFKAKVDQANNELSLFLLREDVRSSNCLYDTNKDHEKRERKNKKGAEYTKTKRDTDICYKLRTNMAANISVRLRDLNIRATGKFRHLDYTVEELKEHLEKQFINGMSWNNYGDWHVDHIKPASLFKYTSVEDEGFKECWALSNLQPLWAFDNLSKGDKWDG